MKVKNPPLGIVLGLIAGVALTFAYTKFIGNNQGSETDRRIALLEQRLSQLQQQRHDAKQNSKESEELAGLRKHLLQHQADNGFEQIEPADGIDDLSVQENILSLSGGNPELRREQARQQEMELRATIEDNFANDDASDPDWALSTQTNIETAFIESQSLVGSGLVSSECKSTMCRLEISPDLTTLNGDMAMYQNELLVALAGDLTTSALRVETDSEGRPRIIGYFGREGSSITKRKSAESTPASP